MSSSLLTLVQDEHFVVKISIAVAEPLALSLAALSGSMFITASYIAEWWGGSGSQNLFFPFVAVWGGFGQFFAAIFAFLAGEVLLTVINALWGALWIAMGLLYLLAVCDRLASVLSMFILTSALQRHRPRKHLPAYSYTFPSSQLGSLLYPSSLGLECVYHIQPLKRSS